MVARAELVVVQVAQFAVGANPDASVCAVAFDVNIAGPGADRVEQDGLVDRHQVVAKLCLGLVEQILETILFASRRHFLGRQCIAAAGDVDIRPDTPEIRRRDQQLDHAAVRMHVRDIVGLHVRVVGGDDQLVVLHAYWNQTLVVQKRLGEDPEQPRIEIGHGLLGVHEPQAVLVRQRPVQIGVLHLQVAPHHLQYRLAQPFSLAPCRLQCVLFDVAQIDQDLAGVAGENYRAQAPSQEFVVVPTVQHQFVGLAVDALEAHQVAACVKLLQQLGDVRKVTSHQDSLERHARRQALLAVADDDLDVPDPGLFQITPGDLGDRLVALDQQHLPGQV